MVLVSVIILYILSLIVCLRFLYMALIVMMRYGLEEEDVKMMMISIVLTFIPAFNTVMAIRVIISILKHKEE